MALPINILDLVVWPFILLIVAAAGLLNFKMMIQMAIKYGSNAVGRNSSWLWKNVAHPSLVTLSTVFSKIFERPERMSISLTHVLLYACLIVLVIIASSHNEKPQRKSEDEK